MKNYLHTQDWEKIENSRWEIFTEHSISEKKTSTSKIGKIPWHSRLENLLQKQYCEKKSTLTIGKNNNSIVKVKEKTQQHRLEKLLNYKCCKRSQHTRLENKPTIQTGKTTKPPS